MPDARLDANGDLAIPSSWVRGVEAVAQRVRVRLSTWRGEWGLDVDAGVPFEAWIQARPIPQAEIEATIRREIETTSGVVRVVSLTGSRPSPDAIAVAVEAEVYEDGEAGRIVVQVGTERRGVGAPPVWTVRAGLRAARVAS